MARWIRQALSVAAALLFACGGRSTSDHGAAGLGASGGSSGTAPGSGGGAGGGGGSGTGASPGLGATSGGGTAGAASGGGGIAGAQCNTGKGGVAGALYTPNSVGCDGRVPMIVDIKGFPAKKPACSGTTPFCKVGECGPTTEPLFCCNGQTPECRACPPGSVSTGSFCIEQHEVTRGEYDGWLATSPKPQPGSQCVSYQPDSACIALPEVCKTGCGTHPQVCVSGCQATAFCAAKGESVCSAEQLAEACIASYPYGGTYDPLACNGFDSGVGTTAPVGSFPKCAATTLGGLVFDLSGNVAERSYFSGKYTHSGGSYADPKSALSCAPTAAPTAGEPSPTIGFRCCTPK